MNDGGARAGARAALPYTRNSVVVVTEVRTGTAAASGGGVIDDAGPPDCIEADSSVKSKPLSAR